MHRRSAEPDAEQQASSHSIRLPLAVALRLYRLLCRQRGRY